MTALALIDGNSFYCSCERVFDAKLERKIARMAAKGIPPKAKASVTWSEEVVVQAVDILTGIDDHHATRRDRKGWSMAHSSLGHWAHGALRYDRYREAALKLARAILSGYAKQLGPFMPGVDLQC